jgi:hypothetical protein
LSCISLCTFVGLHFTGLICLICRRAGGAG